MKFDKTQTRIAQRIAAKAKDRGITLTEEEIESIINSFYSTVHNLIKKSKSVPIPYICTFYLNKDREEKNKNRLLKKGYSTKKSITFQDGFIKFKK